jgi:activator of HSP90 ATPase
MMSGGGAFGPGGGPMTYDFEVSGTVPVSCEEVYRAWLSSEKHTAMTGGDAVIEPKIGGAFTAWGSYITGTTLDLEPFYRIVQSWRTEQFTEADEDSQIEVTFEPVGDETLVRIRHTNVPSEHRGYEDGGWQKSYLDPMKAYFSSR